MAGTAVFVRRLLAWGRANRRDFPWRTETDPFRVLVAEVLLQRSRGSTVARVYPRLFDRWPNAEALAAAQERSIASVIRPLGLTSRARTLRLMAAEIAARGAVPGSTAGLLELSGVGPYAAAATATVAFGRREAVVDGVSARVYRRYFGLPGSGPVAGDAPLREVVEAATPRRAAREWNWAVLDLAALVCLPKVPRCDACPLRGSCRGSSI